MAKRKTTKPPSDPPPDSSFSLSETERRQITERVMEEALRLFRNDATEKVYERKLYDLLIKSFQEIKK